MVTTKNSLEDHNFADFFIQQYTFPFLYCVTLERWAYMVELMLPKKLGMSTLVKIRIIQIFKADYNFTPSNNMGKETRLERTNVQVIHVSTTSTSW